ncbi:MAG TPA: protein kinase [Terriglobales bacterium]|nr:protein kinase [Terriglobales bacterium]
MPLARKLGPYEIRSPLGAGGIGEVYRACDARLNGDVAIKVLPAAFARDAERLRRFQQEAQAVAALNHPNILAIHDFGEHDGSPFIVTEYLDRESVRAALAKELCRSAKPSTMGCRSRAGWQRHMKRGSSTAI